MPSTAPGSTGSTMCGAVPSTIMTPAEGTTMPSKLSLSEEQCRNSTSLCSAISSPRRRIRVDLPTPGPPFRIKMRVAASGRMTWS